MGHSLNETDDRVMHRQVDWMVAADVLILEFLLSARDRRGDPSIQTPLTIHLNTGYSRQHASGRCQVLAEHGLIERHSEGQYQLADLGRRAIENEISIEELNELAAGGDENTEE